MNEGENNENIDPNKNKEDSELSGWDEASQDVPKLPAINIERDLLIAKGYLQKIGCRNETTWDHLNDIINHVLKERPKDCMRYFEELSREIRIKKFFLAKECDETYKEFTEEPKETDESKFLLRFYRRVECFYQSESCYEDKFGNLDFVPFFRLLNEAGVGFPYADTYNIQMAMRLLLKTYPILNLNLWGKIMGTVRDYIVVEAELTQEAMGDRFKDFMSVAVQSMHKEVEEEEEALPELENEEVLKEFMSEEGSAIEPTPKRKLDLYVSPPIPLPVLPENVIIPVEPPGHGTNRKVYFVTNEPGEEWVLLPDVTPQQIVTARVIQRYFTGILSSKISSFPEFPGTEKEYLRAQIARITASTHVSPLGFYSSGDEEEAVEIEEGQMYTENVDYQPHPIKDLLDPTLEFWVHHEPYILKQGRTEFWAPDLVNEEVEDEGDLNQVVREKGPPILSTLSGDVMKPEPSPSWSVRRASTLLDEDTAVVLRSNIWPGALTAAKERLFVNFYVGWGNKCNLNGFSPIISSKIQLEYEIGPEIMEIADPTVEMEEFRWLQLHPKIKQRDIVEEEHYEAEEQVDDDDN